MSDGSSPATGKTRVLIIPHQPHRNLKVRAIEMGQYLANLPGYEVFMLTWELSGAPAANLPGKILGKSVEAFKTSRAASSITREDGLNWVKIPHLLAPYPLCKDFNQNRLTSFVSEHRIDIIISGNAYHFPMPEIPGLQRIYDVVDDHISPGSGPQWQRTRKFTLDELRKSDRVITITHALQEALEREGFGQAIRIPNGVDMTAFRNVSADVVSAFRKRYELDGRFAIGYIGNHGWWGGMELLLNAFEELKKNVPQGRLLVIGPGEDLPRFKEACAGNPDIVFTGPISPAEIAACFHGIDLGVLPFEICPFTDNALPLKILEYGAARKKVVATPLKELKTLAFPHVSLINPDPAIWAKALANEAMAPSAWEAGWDTVIAGYDWPVVLKDLREIVEGLHAAAV